jgi:aspartyl-tRNA(Asn)/glutamyl-tRNA(Gln) amidotransferase subunit A
MPNVLSSLPSPFSANEEEKVDFLMHPTAIRAPPLLSSPSLQRMSGYVQDVLTVPASLAGVPVVSVPCGVGYRDERPLWGEGQGDDDGDTAGWPVGVSIVGQWGGDEGVLSVARVVEKCVMER